MIHFLRSGYWSGKVSVRDIVRLGLGAGFSKTRIHATARPMAMLEAYGYRTNSHLVF